MYIYIYIDVYTSCVSLRNVHLRFIVQQMSVASFLYDAWQKPEALQKHPIASNLGLMQTQKAKNSISKCDIILLLDLVYCY